MELLALTDFIKYILAGAGVGFAVGLTGVGGGSLMTPLLILFNFPPHIAIGTDLMYAAGTKASGVITHAKQATVNWQIVLRLSAGSIPASLITVYLLKNIFGDPESYQHILLSTLGYMLIATAIVIIFKPILSKSHKVSDDEYSFLKKHQGNITIFFGIILGVCVTLTSVGAGAFGAAVLMLLYPRLSPVTIIGTDIAHAVPLTLIAGLGHMQLGNVDFVLLSSLLIGSIPAIHFGSKLSKKLPSHILQPILATILMVIGIKYALL
jgi:uncharacterized membrane protein YfcA